MARVRGGDVVEVGRDLLLEGGQLVLALVVLLLLLLAGEGGIGASVAGAVAALVGASVSVSFISLYSLSSSPEKGLLTAQDYHSSKTPSYKPHKHTASPAYASSHAS